MSAAAITGTATINPRTLKPGTAVSTSAANAASPLPDVVRIRPLDPQAAAVFAEAKLVKASVD